MWFGKVEEWKGGITSGQSGILPVKELIARSGEDGDGDNEKK